MSYAMEYFRQSGLEELVGSGKIDTAPINEIVDVVKHYIKNRQEITAAQSNDPLSVFSKKIDDKQLMTGALFYNKIFVPDPVVADCGEAVLLFPSFPIEKNDPSIALRKAVKDAVAFYKFYHPLIDAGIIVPVSTPNEIKTIPVFMPSTDFSKGIPPHILEFLISSTRVHSCQKIDTDKLVFLQEKNGKLTPSNMIMIDIFGTQYMYQLCQTESFAHENGNNFRIGFNLVKQDTISEAHFSNWVKQSIFQTIRRLLSELQKTIQVSAILGCCYQTNSNCEKKILEQSYGAITNAPINFLNVNLSDIRFSRPSEIARFRKKNVKYFNRFQRTIQEITFDLRNLSAEEFKTKAALKLSNEIYPQVEEIKKQLKSNLIASMATSTAATALDIGIAVASGGALSLASVLGFLALGAALPVGKQIKEYFDSKKTPEFIWSQLLK